MRSGWTRLGWGAILGVFLAVSLAAAQQPAPAPAPTPPATFNPETDWPTYDFGNPGDEHAIKRGPGFYLHSVKIVLFVLMFFCWARTTQWVSEDCDANNMDYMIWTSACAFPFLLAMVSLAWLMPYYILGFFFLALCYGVPLGIYIYLRNDKLPPGKHVLTMEWFRETYADMVGKFGVQVDRTPKLAHEEGPPITLIGQGAASEQANQANTIMARQAPGYLKAKEVIHDGLTRLVDKIVLDYSQTGVTVRFQIDGVFFDAAPMDRENGDAMLVVLKKLGNLSETERVKKQEGKFIVESGQGKAQRKTTLQFLSQGTQTGERVVISFPVTAVELKTTADIGMREKMAEQLKEILAQPRGLVIFSSLPGNGLTTTTCAILRALDRYMRDFIAIDDINKKEPEVENIALETYNPAEGKTLMQVLPPILRKLPNVVIVREPTEPDAVKLLCESAADEDEHIMSLLTVRAKEANEAFLRILAMKVPAASLAPVAMASLHVRLIRKLCDHCKEAYPATPEMLQKLGIPPGRIEVLYKEPAPPPPNPPPDQPVKEPCQHCGAIGYKGRTAIFELVTVDAALKQVLLKEPKIETLRAAARKAGSRSLQEEGIVLVAKGVTSISELSRVLKQ